ncbi:MAG: glycerol-3-phosphate 1-O-acyltransferase PlsY [Clostridia bacterium]|nr:glycerol-3-phosphate 1-O-acyltransferase PlsY [Clostridia bacterium]
MINTNILLAFAAVILAYLIGSINFAVIFSRIFIKKDIREVGSGNAGMTNVMRVAGALPGILTFVFDALKGFVACFIGKMIFSHLHTVTENPFFLAIYGVFICGVACMLGHVFPVFFSFKGGKGVAVSVGIFAVCCPIAIISGLILFGILLATVKVMSISSLSATVVVVGASLIFYDKSALFWPQAVCAVIMGAIVFLKHKDNIVRLVRGEENKFTIKKG